MNPPKKDWPLGPLQRQMLALIKERGEYRIDPKYHKDRAVVRCLDALVNRGLVVYDAEIKTYRLL